MGNELGNTTVFESNKYLKEPLLYYKTKEDIETYRRKPVRLKLQWLQAQMEFFHKAMPEKAKRVSSPLVGEGWVRGLKMTEFNQKEYQTVILGALLHDVGKMHEYYY